jgi:hypothetical protein
MFKHRFNFFDTIWLSLVCLLSFVANAGINVPFTGSNPPSVDSQTIFQYRGDVDGAGSLEDWSGENLLLNSEDFSSWTAVALTSVSANIVKNPLDNLLTADGFIATAVDTQHGTTQAVTLTAVNHKLGVLAKVGNVNWLYLGDSTVANAYSYFNLSSGVVGTKGAGCLNNWIFPLGGGWYVASIEFTGTAASHTIQVYSALADTDNDFAGDAATINTYVVAARLESKPTYKDYANIYKQTGASAKPRLDLTQNGNPTSGFSDLQMSDGNRMMGRSLNGTTQWYSRGHDASMNVFDQDHTITFALTKSTTSVGEDYLFDKSTSAARGLLIEQITVAGPFLAYYYNSSGAQLVVTGPATAINDGRTHILQLVRNNNIATVYLDSIAGTPVDITGYGYDGNGGLWLEAWAGTANYTWQGSVFFTQLDSRALSATELAAQREAIWGLYSNKSKDIQSWTYSRSTSASKTLSSGPTSISTVAAGVPRVGGQSGGVTIEGPSTNSFQYSENKSGFSQFSTGTIAFGLDTIVAPNGTLTADSVSDTNEAGPLNYTIGQNATNPVTSGTVYTVSWHIKPLPTITAEGKNLDFRFINGAHDSEDIFNITTGQFGTHGGTALIGRKAEAMPDGYWRVSFTLTALSTANLNTVVYLNSGVAYTATGNAQFAIWGSQTEPLPFMSSYIPNLSTGSTTRTADNLSIPLHQAGTNKDLLPTVFGPLPNQANTLTIEFDMKAEFNNTNATYDIPVYISTLSGNYARIYNYINYTQMYFEVNGADYIIYNVSTVDFSKWHRYKAFIDYSDLSRSYFSIDGVHATVYAGTWTGTKTMDTTGGTVLLSSTYNFHNIKNLRINEVEF